MAQRRDHGCRRAIQEVPSLLTGPFQEGKAGDKALLVKTGFSAIFPTVNNEGIGD